MKRKIHRHLFSMALTLSLSFPASALLPVIVVADGPSMKNQFVNYSQMLKEYAMMLDQLREMERQYEQMQKDYNSITGSRNLGEIFNDPAFQQYLPDDFTTIYNNVRNNGYDGLTGSAKALRDISKVFDSCEKKPDPLRRKICIALSLKPAQDQAFALDAYAKSVNRNQQISNLMSEINNTQDPKSIAELNARISAEQTLVANEQTRLNMYEAVAKSEEILLQQQEHEAMMKILSSTNYGTIPSRMVFN